MRSAHKLIRTGFLSTAHISATCATLCCHNAGVVFVSSLVKQDTVSLLCRLRHCSSLATSATSSSTSRSCFILGANSAIGEVDALQSFTQHIGSKNTWEIFSVARQVALRSRQAGSVPVTSHALVDFAQQAAAVLHQRRQQARELSVHGTVRALRASSGLAEILHDSEFPALPFAARQASARSRTGVPSAACLQIMQYTAGLQQALEQKLATADSTISNTELLTALQACVQALNAVTSAPGAPQPDASRQLEQCARFMISHVRSLPAEVPPGSAERAQRTLTRQDRRVLNLVIATLEAMQDCEYPACFSLSAELMLATVSQLQRTTKAQAHMQGVLMTTSQMSSFICSLIVLFSRNPDAVRASIAGQFIPVIRVSQHSESVHRRLAFMINKLRNAKVLAGDFLHRILGRWIRLVSAGQVDVNNMCAVLQVLQSCQQVKEQAVGVVVPTRGVQVVAGAFDDRVRAAVCADVSRRFNDDRDQTKFHAWQYAVLMRAVTTDSHSGDAFSNHAQNAVYAFVQSAADLAAEDMEYVGHTWRLQDLSAVLCAAATHKVSAHRAFSVAAILCQERLKEMRARADADDAAMLAQLESLVWAFAVTRREYPYSADAVCRAAAEALQEVIAAQPEAVDMAVVADILWSFAAMWQTPVGLFELVGRVLDARYTAAQQPLRQDVAESLAWSFMRAAVRLPACVLSSAPDRFTAGI